MIFGVPEAGKEAFMTQGTQVQQITFYGWPPTWCIWDEESACIKILSQPLISCFTLDELFKLFKSQFPHLYNGDNTSQCCHAVKLRKCTYIT